MATAETTPPRRRVGDWELLRPLGRGGMGVVWLGEHHRTGQWAAVKTARAPTPTILASLRHEIDALGRVRDAGVAQLLAYGEEAFLPWLAVELVQGPSLAAVLALRFDPVAADPTERTPGGDPSPELTEAPGGPGLEADAPIVPALADALGEVSGVLELAARIAESLDAIHTTGLVHGDIKPSNVLLRPDGCPVLVDFGLRGHAGDPAGRERVAEVARLPGTAWYAAPERAAGGAIDGRTDLYALGCLLFECLTGHPPFRAATREELVALHASTPAPDLLALRPDAGAGVATLVARLLEKAPSARPAHARDVLARIEGLLGRDTAAGAWAGGRGGVPLEAYLHPAGLVGRADELALLQAAVAAALSGGTAVTLVCGESGAGKTRLLNEAARGTQALDVTAIAGDCAPLAGSDPTIVAPGAQPLAPFRPLLRHVSDLCRSEGPATTAALLGRHLGLLATYEPSLAHLPGAPARPVPPPLLTAEAARWRTLEAMRCVLGALGQRQPVVLLLDNLHWADDASLALITTCLAAPPSGAGVAILGALRPPRDQASLDALVAHPQACVVDLAPIPPEGLVSILHDRVGPGVLSKSVAAWLAERAGGRPALVGELLRVAALDGKVVRGPQGGWVCGEGGASVAAWSDLPCDVGGLTTRRLEALSADERDVVCTAAVLGRETSCGRLEATLGVDPVALRRLLDGLVRRQILAWEPGDRVRFSHDMLWEAVHAGMPPGERRARHERVIRTLRATGPAPGNLARLGHHLEAAGQSGEAATCLAGAAQHALASGAPGDARWLVDRARQTAKDAAGLAGGAPVDEVALGMVRGRASWILGDMPGVIEDLRAVVAACGRELPARGPRLVMRLAAELLALASSAFRRWRHRGADPAQTAQLVRAAELLHRAHFTRSEPLAGLTTCLVTVNAAPFADPVPEVAVAYGSLSLHLGIFGMRRTSRRYARLARETAPLDVHPYEAWTASIPLAAFCVATADWRGLSSLAAEVMPPLERAAAWEPAVFLDMLMALESLARHDGQLAAKASHLARRSRHRANELGVAVASSLHAEAAARSHAWEEAREAAEATAPVLERLGHAALWLARAVLADCDARSGHADRVLAAAEEALEAMPRRDVAFVQATACMRFADALVRIRPTGNRPRVDRALRRLARAARRYARALPVARAAAWWVRAQAADAQGRTRRADRLWRRAERAARDHGLVGLQRPARSASVVPRADEQGGVGARQSDPGSRRRDAVLRPAAALPPPVPCAAGQTPVA